MKNADQERKLLEKAWADSLALAEKLLEEPVITGRSVQRVTDEIAYCRKNYNRAKNAKPE